MLGLLVLTLLWSQVEAWYIPGVLETLPNLPSPPSIGPPIHGI